MLRVGICDESAQDRERIKTLVVSALFRYEEITCIEYAKAETLEQEIEDGSAPFDLLITEIRFQSKNGLALATRIREQKLDLDIIFVTNEPDYVYEGYYVQAQGYVLKKEIEKQLPACLECYIQNYKQEGTITVRSDSVVRTIPVAIIQYVESSARRLVIHTAEESIRFYGKLADIYTQLLPYGFLRIHQSFLVKKSLIREVRGDEALVGTTRLPISRRYAKDVRERFKPSNQKEEICGNRDITVTKSLALRTEENGAIIGTKGELLGIIYRMKRGEELKLGRDALMCQIVLKNPKISRVHCIIKRLENGSYEIEDCSKNGVYMDSFLVGKGNKTQGQAGSSVWLCDELTEFRLG